MNQREVIKVNLFLPLMLMLTLILFAGTTKNFRVKKILYIENDTTKAWKAPESSAKIKNPLAGKKEAVKNGEVLYNQNCIECHGESGKGNGQNAELLDVKPADLTSSKVQQETDGALFWKISNGKGPMAPYENILTKEQRWDLVNYIRKLEKSKKE